MSHDLPTDWSALCALVFLLGMRHGFDADHLATIDGLTRLNRLRHPALARACGTLFSLGHGAVVLLIAGTVGAWQATWQAPEWLGPVGGAISVFFLLALGLANLAAVLRTAPADTVQLVGLKGRWLGRLTRAGSAGGVAGVGALFALSFDTVSQAVLFAATAVPFGGAGHGLMLGGLFVVGMLATDGLNGWWMARLMARADDLAVVASRVMGAAVAGVSLVVGGLGAWRLLQPAWQGGLDGPDWLGGAMVLGVMMTAYALTRHLVPRLAGADKRHRSP